MGGLTNLLPNKLSEKRIPYNFVFRNASKPYNWFSEMYEDTVTPLVKNQQGVFTFQPHFVQLEMKPLAAGASGGMSAMYANMDLFNRISYLYLYSPSCIKLQVVGDKLTHAIRRNNAFPKLVSDKYKKTR